MNRRTFIQSAIAAGGMHTSINSFAAITRNVGSTPELAELSVATAQARMQKGELTSLALCKHYLGRIEAIDRHGPRLNSIIELNPDALAIAAALDRERQASKVRGPLHGVPVLLKDNIATADRMETTAGSLALLGAKPIKDSAIVRQLREAGAVILGKTNLSEWANMRSTRPTSGWSGRGGLTLNPYALNRNCSGSSSGTGAAIAADLAILGVGTETDGSIVSPASICGLVGVKPSIGLVSRNGIIPIAHSQDTAGPMTRTVADAAALLDVLAAPDPRDPVTLAAGRPASFVQQLNETALKGKRIGVARNFFGFHDQVDAVIEQALKDLQALGATLVDPVEVPNVSKYADSEFQALLFEYKDDLKRYLDEFSPNGAIRSMADVIRFNEQHQDRELVHFGQELLMQADATTGLDAPEYQQALANNHRYARQEGIDQVLAEHRLDALVAPTGGVAWVNDLIMGDHTGNGFSSPAAVAGYPHVTVPAGQVGGLPVGLSFVGMAFSDAQLLGMAYAYEQGTRKRQSPRYLPRI
ncbi:amidase [Burkholderiaceae bacterium DAT-1]|nr:amidase [Burkholderiaceae bacterium DAT-1]